MILMILIALFVVLTACTPGRRDIEISSIEDGPVNSKQYKTYFWAGAAAVLFDPNGRWAPPEMDLFSEIQYQVDLHMERRGYKKVVVDGDLGLVIGINVDMETVGARVDRKARTVSFENIPSGALVVALVDAKDGYANWVGSATAPLLEDPTRDTVTKRIDYAVRKIFRKLPRR
jgi:hypothetical protein